MGRWLNCVRQNIQQRRQERRGYNQCSCPPAPRGYRYRSSSPQCGTRNGARLPNRSQFAQSSSMDEMVNSLGTKGAPGLDQLLQRFNGTVNGNTITLSGKIEDMGRIRLGLSDNAPRKWYGTQFSDIKLQRDASCRDTGARGQGYDVRVSYEKDRYGRDTGNVTLSIQLSPQLHRARVDLGNKSYLLDPANLKVTPPARPEPANDPADAPAPPNDPADTPTPTDPPRDNATLRRENTPTPGSETLRSVSPPESYQPEEVELPESIPSNVTRSPIPDSSANPTGGDTTTRREDTPTPGSETLRSVSPPESYQPEEVGVTRVDSIERYSLTYPRFVCQSDRRGYDNSTGGHTDSGLRNSEVSVSSGILSARRSGVTRVDSIERYSLTYPRFVCQSDRRGYDNSTGGHTDSGLRNSEVSVSSGILSARRSGVTRVDSIERYSLTYPRFVCQSDRRGYDNSTGGHSDFGLRNPEVSVSSGGL